MLIFFRDKSITAIFFLVALCLAVHVHFFMAMPKVVISDDDGIFSIILGKYFTQLSGTFLFIIYFLVLLLQAIRFNLVLNELRMYHQSAFITAMVYVLISGMMPQWCAITPAFMVTPLITWIFLSLCRLYNNPSPKTLLFNTGLIVGLTILCYHPTAILVLVVLFALAVVRPFRITEWLVLLIGIIAPYYFLLSYFYMTDQMHLLQRFLPEMRLNLPIEQPGLWGWISISAIGLLLLVSFYYWLPNSNRMVIQIRKNWSVMIVMLLIMLPIPFIFKNAGLESAMVLAVPLAAFISNVFLSARRMFLPNLLLIIVIVIIIHTNWVLV